MARPAAGLTFSQGHAGGGGAAAGLTLSQGHLSVYHPSMAVDNAATQIACCDEEPINGY